MFNKKILGYILLFFGITPIFMALIYEHGLVETLLVLFVAGFFAAVIVIGVILTLEDC